MANFIEHERSLNPESKERIIVDRIRPIDLGKEEGLRSILEMFKDPNNREHLADITQRTSMFNLRDYYSEPGRRGFVGLNNREGLVGVYDLEGPKIRRTTRGYQDVILTLGILNKMCVRSDLQGRGIGDQLTKNAIEQAHYEYGWSNLLAGIVMDEDTTDRIQEARRAQNDRQRERIFLNTFNRLKNTDARVKLFVVKNNFQYSGFNPNVRVGEQIREVLIISHPHPNIIAPQDEGK